MSKAVTQKKPELNNGSAATDKDRALAERLLTKMNEAGKRASAAKVNEGNNAPGRAPGKRERLNEEGDAPIGMTQTAFIPGTASNTAGANETNPAALLNNDNTVEDSECPMCHYMGDPAPDGKCPNCGCAMGDAANDGFEVGDTVAGIALDGPDKSERRVVVGRVILVDDESKSCSVRQLGTKRSYKFPFSALEIVNEDEDEGDPDTTYQAGNGSPEGEMQLECPTCGWTGSASEPGDYACPNDDTVCIVTSVGGPSGGSMDTSFSGDTDTDQVMDQGAQTQQTGADFEDGQPSLPKPLEATVRVAEGSVTAAEEAKRLAGAW